MPNYVAPSPSAKNVTQYTRRKQTIGAGWHERRAPYGWCNCAGLVWASRRTAIDEEDAWKLIMRDDGYRELRQGEEPEPGDLVIYSGEEDVGFLHVGMIIGRVSLLAGGSAQVPVVLSKLSDSFGEVIHREPDIRRLYEDAGLKLSSAYHTDRQ